MRDVFEPAIARTVMPRTVVTLVVQIVHDAGSLWAAATNCCTLALADAGVPLLGLVSAAEALWAARVEKAAFTSSANAGAASAMSEDDASAAASSRSSGAAASSSGGFASSSSGSSRAPVLLLDPAEDELEEASAAPEKWARLLHACLWRGDDASTLRLRCDGALSPDQLAAHSTATHAAAATVLAFLRLALTQRVERDAVCFVGDAAAIGVATTTGTFKRPAAVAVAGAGAGAASESGASAAAPAGATAAVDADDA